LHRAFSPAYAYLHVNIAILKTAMNQPEEAEKYFKNALRLDPDNPEGFYYYARWLSGRKRDREAVALLQKAIGISPGHGSAKSLLNEILI
jgi:protein O-mannosyl-transferase